MPYVTKLAHDFLCSILYIYVFLRKIPFKEKFLQTWNIFMHVLVLTKVGQIRTLL